MCNQTAALIARILEEFEICTVMISLLKEVTEKVRPPRVLEVPFPFGHPFGKAGDKRLQTDIILRCLDLIDSARDAETWWQFE